MDYRLKRLTYSAVSLAAAMLLPFLTGGDMKLGNMLCLMHIPILLCGFICGPVWGCVVGFCAPLLRSLAFGKPQLMPIAASMAAELFGYALIAGALYRIFPKKMPYIYLSLVLAMIGGRLLWAAAQCFLLAGGFTFKLFWLNGFANALPGIALQLALIPQTVFALQKAHLIPVSQDRTQ